MGNCSDDWTFSGAQTRELTHCYHDYPARMIPQVAGKLFDMFAPADAKLAFDPYCGTGTTLVEGLIRGINVAGTDLNPLARLIARAKTELPDLEAVDITSARLNQMARGWRGRADAPTPTIKGIARLEFWFKPNVIAKLCALKSFIGKIEDESVRDFFLVALSETIRESSNTRNDEFKLYRYDETTLATFDPDVFGIMAAKLRRNRAGLSKFAAILDNLAYTPSVRIFDFDTVHGVPENAIAPESVDIIVTSPPYGDSHTTVAYGQYSRLSSAWLDLPEPDKVDSKLMGGRKLKHIPRFPSTALNEAIEEIHKQDEDRAHEVAGFYSDYQKSIAHVAHLLQPGAFACYVVGNRKVKGIPLPTDIATRDFFAHVGCEYVDTFHRGIPNKRMPARNSPTNAPGKVDVTMSHEHIVVMRRSVPKMFRQRKTGAYWVKRRNTRVPAQ